MTFRNYGRGYCRGLSFGMIFPVMFSMLLWGNIVTVRGLRQWAGEGQVLQARVFLSEPAAVYRCHEMVKVARDLVVESGTLIEHLGPIVMPCGEAVNISWWCSGLGMEVLGYVSRGAKVQPGERAVLILRVLREWQLRRRREIVVLIYYDGSVWRGRLLIRDGRRSGLPIGTSVPAGGRGQEAGRRRGR